MKYRYLLIDNDNTLMDFHAAEHAALRETLTEAGLNRPMPSAHGTAPSMTHSGRRSNAAKPPTRRLKSPVSPSFWQNTPPKTSAHSRLALRYSHYLGTHADLMPGAEAFLRRLHGQMKIVLVSNGDSVIQRKSTFPVRVHATAG